MAAISALAPNMLNGPEYRRMGIEFLFRASSLDDKGGRSRPYRIHWPEAHKPSKSALVM